MLSRVVYGVAQVVIKREDGCHLSIDLGLMGHWVGGCEGCGGGAERTITSCLKPVVSESRLVAICGNTGGKARMAYESASPPAEHNGTAPWLHTGRAATTPHYHIDVTSDRLACSRP